MHYVVIGGGIAGTTCAETLRAQNPKAAITILEADAHPCYSRVLLPHYVKGKVPRERVFLRKAEDYEAKDIELLLETEATHIDTKHKYVATSTGREIPYDVLILANGTSPRMIPHDAYGVSYLYNIGDADHLCHLIAEAKTRPDARAVVYGGGFMACEYVNIFAHAGINFVLAMRGAGFWSGRLSARAQSIITEHVKNLGYDVHTNVSMSVSEGVKRGVLCEFSNQTMIEADIVGVGVGINQEDHLAQELGLQTPEGVETDFLHATKEKDVFAIGDASAQYDSRVGKAVRYANFATAQHHGRTFGTEQVSPHISQYSTNILGLNMVFIGNVSRSDATKTREEMISDTAISERFYQGGVLMGAVLIGDLSQRAEIIEELRTHLGNRV
jgi:NAD(P)H-nitrite reductase large subunit